jgi:hypothetical protein
LSSCVGVLIDELLFLGVAIVDGIYCGIESSCIGVPIVVGTYCGIESSRVGVPMDGTLCVGVPMDATLRVGVVLCFSGTLCVDVVIVFLRFSEVCFEDLLRFSGEPSLCVGVMFFLREDLFRFEESDKKSSLCNGVSFDTDMIVLIAFT